jgi:hypothetical protein
MIEHGVGSRTWVVHRALRALGIASDIIVAESQPFSSAPEFPPRTGRFTHPLVRVTVNGQPVWIDADVDGPPLPPGRVSPELRGRQALLTDGSMITVATVDAQDVDRVQIDLTLGSDGDASGTCEIVLFGRPAQRIVEAFEVVVGSAREQLLRQIVLAWMPWADVRKVSLVSDETSWEVHVAAEVNVVGFARPELRDQPLFSLPGFTPVHSLAGPATTLGALYAKQATRETALAIDDPLLFRVERNITLPNSAKVVNLPPDFGVKQPTIEAGRTVKQSGQVIHETFGINLPAGSVSPDQFADFVRIVRDIDDGFMHTTRIELRPAP